MKVTIDTVALLTFAGVIALTCAGLIPAHKGNGQSSFGQPFQTSNLGLQQWNDWMPGKRAGHFGSDPFASPSGYQGWTDWMVKRGLSGIGGPSNFGEFGSSAQMQKWNDWLAKRGLHPISGSPFATSGQFQGWSDWLNKRAGQFGAHDWSSFRSGGNAVFPSFGSSGLQDWSGMELKRNAEDSNEGS